MSMGTTGDVRRFNRGGWFAWSVSALAGIATVWLATSEGTFAIGQSGLLGLFNTASQFLLRLAFAVLGALIITRRPDNSIGWVMLLPALSLFSDLFSKLFLGQMTAPPAQPSTLFLVAVWADRISWVLAVLPLYLILLLFPTGRPPTPRWRGLLFAVVVSQLLLLVIVGLGRHLFPFDARWQVANPIGVIPDVWVERLYSRLFQQLFGVLGLFCAASLYVRYQRGSAVERTQIKWIAYTSTLFSLFFLVAIFVITTSGRGWEDEDLLIQAVQVPAGLMMVATPVAITIAILRHHLFDIHLIIRRTLVYAVLTGMLGAIYLFAIVMLQALFVRLTGQQNTLAVVASTLVIAALFQPLRRRVQTFIDRRFFRRKYDAQQVLAQFATRAQQQADLELVSADLVATVQEALEPEGVRLWLVQTRQSSRGSPEKSA